MQNTTIEQLKLTISILFGSFCASLLIYIWVVIDILSNFVQNQSDFLLFDVFEFSKIPVAFALIAFAISIFFHRWAFSQNRLKNWVKNNSSNNNHDETKRNFVAYLYKYYILNWAINECVGVFGLVGKVIGLQTELSVSLLVTALMLNVYMRPKVDELIKLARL